MRPIWSSRLSWRPNGTSAACRTVGGRAARLAAAVAAEQPGQLRPRLPSDRQEAIDREVALDTPDSSGSPDGQLPANIVSPSGQAAAGERAGWSAGRWTDCLRITAGAHLRYQEGRSFEEIAGLMGRSPNAARKLWARAVEAANGSWPTTCEPSRRVMEVRAMDPSPAGKASGPTRLTRISAPCSPLAMRRWLRAPPPGDPPSGPFGGRLARGVACLKRIRRPWGRRLRTARPAVRRLRDRS